VYSRSVKPPEMDEILKQLGGLVLGSVPTILLFLVAFAAYRVIVYSPLSRVLSERRGQTEGALEKARADIAAAEAKVAEYENALREARMTIFRSQESRRQKALEARAQVVTEARAQAEAQVREARAAIGAQIAQSKASLQSESQRLAKEVIEAIFRHVGVAHSSPVGGGQ
jgi:F-type H+-transporting ATPase subunit b